MGIAVLVSLAGFVIAITGAFVFMPAAPVLPVFSAGDWPGLIMMFLGASWSLLGTFQFFRHGRGFLAKAALGFLCLITVAGTTANSYWVLELSYDIPPPAVLPAAKPIPAFELTDQNGKTVSDTSLRGKPFVLIFARGVW